jgi:hypothetical protein
VAHVGIELLLDGELVANEAPCAEYLEALALAREDRLGAGIRFRRPEHAARFQHVRARLEEWGVPDGYADPAFVAERVIGALRNRPRLALTPGDARLVRAWMPRAKVQVVADAGGLLNEVRAGLVHVDTSPSRRGILPAP